MAKSIWLDPAIKQRLDQRAAQTGRTKAYYLCERGHRDDGAHPQGR